MNQIEAKIKLQARIVDKIQIEKISIYKLPLIIFFSTLLLQVVTKPVATPIPHPKSQVYFNRSTVSFQRNLQVRFPRSSDSNQRLIETNFGDVFR